jgi:hypothetical protein
LALWHGHINPPNLVFTLIWLEHFIQKMYLKCHFAVTRHALTSVYLCMFLGSLNMNVQETNYSNRFVLA